MKHNFYKKLLCAAALTGFFGVAFGAFGAHFLRSRLDVDSMEILRTAILYLFIHTLATIAVVILGNADHQSRILKSTGVFFVTGITLFTGSLLLIATRVLTGLEDIPFGIITPIGGVFFLMGWACLVYYSIIQKI